MNCERAGGSGWGWMLLMALVFSTVGVEAQPLFTNVTLEAGIVHEHLRPNLPQEQSWMSGGGVADDFDGDGWVDLFVLQGAEVPCLLYMNRGDGTFANEAVLRGAAIQANFSGATAADYDNDGDIDILAARQLNTLVLLVNNGAGFFSVHPTAFPAVPIVRLLYPMSPSWGDVDNDGLLDLAVGDWSPEGNHLHLYRNTGSTLEHYDFSTEPFDNRWVFSPRFADVNNDRLVDLLVTSDFGNSQLYLNAGGGLFARVTPTHGTGTDENGMGSAVGDYDNDGDLDWFVSSIFQLEGERLNWGTNGNRMYRNDGSGRFTDATDAAGVRDGNWGWGSAFGDFDNDGDLDLFHVNGWPDTRISLQLFNSKPARLFMNLGDGSFLENALSFGVADRGQGRGVVVFDYDNDGDLDLFVCNNQHVDNISMLRSPGPPALYQNISPVSRPWLKVTMNGLPPYHRDGIGSRVYVTTGHGTQMRELDASTGFLAHGPGRIAHFGLGTNLIVQAVRGEWSSGDATLLWNVPARQSISLPSPSLTVPRRTYQLGEAVTLSGGGVSPQGHRREWRVEGRTLPDPMAAAFSTPGRKVLELVVYEAGGVAPMKGERVWIDVAGFELTPAFRVSDGPLELIWRSVEGWRYQVECCTNLTGVAWADVGEPIVGGAGGTIVKVLDQVPGAAFYRVRVE